MTVFNTPYFDTFPGLNGPLTQVEDSTGWSFDGYQWEDIQQWFPYLPTQTVMLGIAEDERPILFDLTDSSTGPIMTISQNRDINLQLFQSVLASSASYNRPAEVSDVIFSQNPEAWHKTIARAGINAHTKGLYSLHDREAAGQIMQWAEQAEQRYTGRSTGPAMLLVFDDLRFLQRADYDVRVQFAWLLQNGPGVQIWPLAGISAGDVHLMGDWMAYFKRRIFGPVGKNYLAERGEDISILESLAPGKQFAIQYHHHWVKFWLPV
jgi:hypothetical protein